MHIGQANNDEDITQRCKSFAIYKRKQGWVAEGGESEKIPALFLSYYATSDAALCLYKLILLFLKKVHISRNNILSLPGGSQIKEAGIYGY